MILRAISWLAGSSTLFRVISVLGVTLLTVGGTLTISNWYQQFRGKTEIQELKKEVGDLVEELGIAHGKIFVANNEVERAEQSIKTVLDTVEFLKRKNKEAESLSIARLGRLKKAESKLQDDQLKINHEASKNEHVKIWLDAVAPLYIQCIQWMHINKEPHQSCKATIKRTQNIIEGIYFVGGKIQPPSDVSK